MLSLGKFALAMAVIPFLSKCTFSCHKNNRSSDEYKHEITFNEWSALAKKLEQPTYEHASLNYCDFYQSSSGTNLVEESFEYSFVNGEYFINIIIDDTYKLRYRYDEPFGGLPTQIYDFHERFLSADIYNDEIAEAIESAGYDFGQSVYETTRDFDYYN